MAIAASQGFKLSLDQVNYLNIGLMLVSAGFAFFIPFELFLLAYAVLGPLHYLTEISWLHDKKFFSPKKWDWLPLGILSLFITIAFLYGRVEPFENFLNNNGMKAVGQFFDDWSHTFTFAGFGIALIFVVSRDRWVRIIGSIVLLFLTLVYHQATFFTYEPGNQASVMKYLKSQFGSFPLKLFAIYLPTLIHVYLFTGAFILVGSLKSKSKSGYLSFAVFIFCAIACLFLLPVESVHVTEWARSNYESTFKSLSEYMLVDLKSVQLPELFGQGFDIFSDKRSIMIARFIGFAYTYHYLNWFSKTSVIRWHEVPKARFAAVIVLWVGSVGLYFWDYQIGFNWLFLLSFAHVLLEFPLNHQSFLQIGQEIGARLGMGGNKAPAKR